MRIVCQAFNKTFQQHGSLTSFIVIGNQVQSCQLPSLLKWLRHHHAQLKQLHVKHGSPWQEMALMALHSPDACLEALHFYETVPEQTLFLLSDFQSITACTLCSSAADTLNLQPLSSLPLLKSLALRNGNFSHLDAAAHLTALRSDHATVHCVQSCSCVTSLVKLSLVCANLIQFHPRNVAACSRLESVVLFSATIGVHDHDEDLAFPADDEASIPTGLSALTTLTSLDLSCQDHDMQLEWVTVLSALQCFTLEASKAVFPASWSTMTSLETLAVSLYTEEGVKERQLFFQFDLGTLASLRTFDLRGLTVSAERLSGLASLHNLQEVVLDNVKPSDVGTAREMGLFTFELGRNRQDVQVDICTTSY